MDYVPRAYQEQTTQMIIDNPRMLVILEMGLGKTVSTLTAIDYLLNVTCEVKRILVIAPKKVADITWTEEMSKWNHLQNLKWSKMMGHEKERISALKQEAHLYIINVDNIVWLCNYLRQNNNNKFPFDMIVIDESSTFKNPASERFKAMKKVVSAIKRIVLLTGTPAPNGLQDLWSQMYLIDKGERLGSCITRFRERYMTQNPYIHCWYMKSGVEEEIYDKISDVSFVLRTKDNLKLPERIDNIIKVPMTEDAKAKYTELERDYLLELDETTIDVANSGVLCGKLIQMANGFVYDENQKATIIHNLKIEALRDLYEQADGKPILVFYWYKQDLESIKADFKGAVELKGSSEMERWNKGSIKMLLAHPASAGHGLNLQYGGNIIVWYSMTWSLELYEQACARLHRQGQINTTIINHLVMEDTIDEDIVEKLRTKSLNQNNLKESIIERRKKYQRTC